METRCQLLAGSQRIDAYARNQLPDAAEDEERRLHSAFGLLPGVCPGGTDPSAFGTPQRRLRARRRVVHDAHLSPASGTP